MRPLEIESWALRIIDQVRSGHPFEDMRVELKSEWADPKKAARQIAAHANAARGEPILWLIGIDKEKGIVGAIHEELANWYPRVRAEFDELAPSVVDLNIPVDGRVVVALLFETNRVPFVVKNPTYGTQGGGSVEREVPWREGTSTRSARRSEILRLLSPAQTLPSLEVLSARLGHQIESARQGELQDYAYWSFESRVYVVPTSETRVIIPFHRCKGSIEVQGMLAVTPINRIFLGPLPEGIPFPRGQALTPPKPSSYTIVGTNTEVIIEGPGMLRVHASLKAQLTERRDPPGDAIVEIDLLPIDAERSVRLEALLSYVESARESFWKLGAE